MEAQTADARLPRGPRLLVAAGMPAALRRHGWPLVGYLALTAALLWPAVRRLHSHFLSDGYDGALYLWNDWQAPRALGALLHLHTPFFTDAQFYPVGVRLGFATSNWLEALLSWPLARLLGFTPAVNLLQLSAIVLTGFGAYLLALHECGDRRAAFLAGAAFTFAPYRFVHLLGHFSLGHMEFLPFGLLALLLLYERPTHGRALTLGAVCGLTLWTDEYYTAFLGLAALVVAAWRWRETRTRLIAVRLAQAVAVAALITSLLLIEMLLELRAHEVDRPAGWFGAPDLSADALSWFVPSATQPLWGGHFSRT